MVMMVAQSLLADVSFVSLQKSVWLTQMPVWAGFLHGWHTASAFAVVPSGLSLSLRSFDIPTSCGLYFTPSLLGLVFMISKCRKQTCKYVHSKMKTTANVYTVLMKNGRF